MTEPIRIETAFPGDFLTIDPPNSEGLSALMIGDDDGRKLTFLDAGQARELATALQNFFPQ